MGSEFSETTEIARDLVMESKLAQDDWIKWAALSSMVMALFTAIGSLFANFTANESVLERTEEILEASYLENDRLRVEVLLAKHEILNALAPSNKSTDRATLRHLNAEITRLEKAIKADEAIVQSYSFSHEIFSIGIALLSVAIALSGMGIIANRKFPWITGLVFGVTGCAFVLYGLFNFSPT